MITKDIEIKAPHGLHLRVAAKIVEKTKDSQSKIVFYKDGQEANAASILELLLLGAVENSTMTVTVTGSDEEIAFKHVSEILMDGAGI